MGLSTKTAKTITAVAFTGALSALLLTFDVGAALAAQIVGGYQGLEFFGSSQITRKDIEKILALRTGASADSAARAIQRLQKRLDEKHLRSTIDVADTADGFFITVDIEEARSSGVPTRKLVFPRHIELSTEHPFALYDQMMSRREKLSAQGKAVTENWDDQFGVKYFSDEPCNRLAEELLKEVPQMRDQFLQVIASDPNAERRSKSIEVLHWGMQPIRTCYDLIPALDDASERVRVSAARFIYPRIKLLPADFPFDSLVEGFSHQLSRQSHIDRMIGLRALIELAKLQPDQLRAIKIFDEERLRELTENSSVPAIKQGAQQLLVMCQNPPPMRAPPEPPRGF